MTDAPFEIRIDAERCMGSGNCLFWAPETFDLGEAGHAVVLDPAATDEEKIRIAAARLPRGRHLPVARRRGAIAGGQDLMPIAVTEEHESLRRTAERWLATHCPPTEPRGVAEATPGQIDLPPVWEKMAAQGWLGLHLPEEHGGQGFTLAETAVVLEELGHALFPGPLLSTLLVSAALARQPDLDAVGPLLAGLADGTVTARRRPRRRTAACGAPARRHPRPARHRAARAGPAGRPSRPGAARRGPRRGELGRARP